jgi:hypothetical protein
MNFRKEWDNVLEERKAATLKLRMEKDCLDQDGQTLFQKFNNFLVVILLVAIPVGTATALVWTAKSCSHYKGVVKIEKTQQKK